MFYLYNDDLSIQLYEEKDPLILDADKKSMLKEVHEEDIIIGFNGEPYLKSDITSAKYLRLKKENDDRKEKYSLLKYLADTDYIITKLNEAQIEGTDDFISLKAKYADILTKRRLTRERLKTLSIIL